VAGTTAADPSKGARHRGGARSIPPDLEDRGADGISPSSCRVAAAGGKTGKSSRRRGSRDFGGAGAGGLKPLVSYSLRFPNRSRFGQGLSQILGI
jgi:hypothetical protein